MTVLTEEEVRAAACSTDGRTTAAWKFMNTPLSREWIRNQPESRSLGRSVARAVGERTVVGR